MFLTEKLKNFVGINESDRYDDEYEEMVWDPNTEEEHSTAETQEYSQPRPRNSETLNLTTEPNMGNSRSNVIGMPGITNSIAEVVVVEPHSFDEMPQVIQTLRERKSVVLNLNAMDSEEAQRAVDFVAGGTYAIDGHQERIGESIFLFTPSCVKVSTLSGTVHDVPDVPAGTPRNPSPAPSWGVEGNRLVQ
ncbi:MAG TPA: cell division protein SepF [Cyanothece sp. UBA12306]|nr:cell division protein SepF [Cyanothece sp. UBA12306]